MMGWGNIGGRFHGSDSRRSTRDPILAVVSSLMASVPQGASAAVLKPSEAIPEETVAVQGPNFDERLTLDSLLGSYERIGFQANSLGKAINIVNKMVRLTHHQPKLIVMRSFSTASLAPFR